MGVNLLNVISLVYLKFIEGEKKTATTTKKNNTPLVLRIYQSV